jgi:hypothetical protein
LFAILYLPAVRHLLFVIFMFVPVFQDRRKPLSFSVGTGRVIAGWDEGLMSMKVGED